MQYPRRIVLGVLLFAVREADNAMNDWSDEEPHDPLYADRRNFYKVEKWSRDGLRVELVLYAGNNLGSSVSFVCSRLKYPVRTPPLHRKSKPLFPVSSLEWRA